MEPTTNPAPTAHAASRTYLNVVLTAIALLLAVQAIKPDASWGTPALAQPGDVREEPANERISAAEQRKQIIAELRTLGRKLDKVDGMLTKGIKVSEMPELKLPSELREAIKSPRADRNAK